MLPRTLSCPPARRLISKGRSTGLRAATSKAVKQSQTNSNKVLRLDTELSGAWSTEGARSKKWFEEMEKERQDKVQSVWARHLLVGTKEMAEDLLKQAQQGADFEELCKQISACETTREKGGEIGWVGEEDEHLEELLPSAVRAAALVRKPGDMVVCESALGHHIVLVEDVMYDLRKSTLPRSMPYGRDGAAYFRPLKELLAAEPD
eukprot:CAMPEP_0181318682 /NCGR_PEP_ID=MMETSP1101-20121128/17139_1 /TAXON_ID=46948 /ORGANISM="Rhodomonas abbreviata, Strain Caron Lab Isolate" /LENGTH=205 /DNA_ID=CAMNT_0023426173 /DNA_START=194 /DNA_END=808 /DNA_ORIENTATION=+